MDTKPSDESKGQTAEPPAPETLAPRTEDGSQPAEPVTPNDGKLVRARRSTYRPSHKATFIGLAAVIAVLAVNAGIIAFVIKSQNKKTTLNQDQVTINQSALDKLGVNRSSAGDLGVLLTVGPDARFNGKVTIDGETNIAGQLKLNSKFSASDANLTQLEAGNTSLSQLSVNGNTTLSALNLRNNLVVAGTTQLQGAVTINQLLTINNSETVTGNLSVGGTLSVSNLHVSSFTSDSTLTIGGHVITRGLSPSIAAGGSALGSNGTVSISGNDAAGTIGVNIGVGATGGLLASVTFKNAYGATPHVVVTPIGNVGTFYISRNASGFSIFAGSGISPGGYAFDYIVEQ